MDKGLANPYTTLQSGTTLANRAPARASTTGSGQTPRPPKERANAVQERGRGRGRGRGIRRGQGNRPRQSAAPQRVHVDPEAKISWTW